jgi:hypothetical protein
MALVTSAFLLVAVLSALAFVGVWRHTATEGDRARQAQTDSDADRLHPELVDAEIDPAFLAAQV